MAKHGKKYTDVAKKAPTEAVSLAEAIAFIKANPIAKFDETMELGMRMGCDSRKSDQMIRGTVSLPHGTGKHVRVAVFAGGTAADAAREAGADFVGNEDLIEKVKGGWTDFDVAIATPEAMQGVRKIARQLGPRGLMPNPKSGTVTTDIEKAIKEIKAGKVEYRVDKQGNINVSIGRASFSTEKLAENFKALKDAIMKAKPATVKGAYIKNVVVSSSMGPGVKVDYSNF